MAIKIKGRKVTFTGKHELWLSGMAYSIGLTPQQLFDVSMKAMIKEWHRKMDEKRSKKHG